VQGHTELAGWAHKLSRVCASPQAYFERSAVTIQRRWRGHHSRQCVHDLRARRGFLAAARRRSQAARDAGADDRLAVCR